MVTYTRFSRYFCVLGGVFLSGWLSPDVSVVSQAVLWGQRPWCSRVDSWTLKNAEVMKLAPYTFMNWIRDMAENYWTIMSWGGLGYGVFYNVIFVPLWIESETRRKHTCKKGAPRTDVVSGDRIIPPIYTPEKNHIFNLNVHVDLVSDDFPFPRGFFLGSMLVSRGVFQLWSSAIWSGYNPILRSLGLTLQGLGWSWWGKKREGENGMTWVFHIDFWVTPSPTLDPWIMSEGFSRTPKNPEDMGMVWETYHKGVPLLGVPGITLDPWIRMSWSCLHIDRINGTGIFNYMYHLKKMKQM